MDDEFAPTTCEVPIGTAHKQMNKFECKKLVAFYPQQDVNIVYTSTMDNNLKPLAQNIMAPDKLSKDF